MTETLYDLIVNNHDINYQRFSEPQNEVSPDFSLPSNMVLRENTSLKTSALGLINIAAFEGLSNYLYLDSGGVRTIGIGMTSSEIPNINTWKWDVELSTIDCVNLYKHALIKYENAVKAALKVKITQNQFDALVSITYNIGAGGMRTSTFMRLLNSDDTDKNIANAFLRWNKDNGKTVKGLTNRRNKEAQMFLKGVYESQGNIPFITVNKSHQPQYKTMINIRDYL